MLVRSKFFVLASIEKASGNTFLTFSTSEDGDKAEDTITRSSCDRKSVSPSVEYRPWQNSQREASIDPDWDDSNLNQLNCSAEYC
ncbi:hypothetical protein P5673_027516 [Acropora cervicornis]|uniref:Uncharacterized protein n=1 Tax=Acropora cervicornis TaxID=6130 RepID=A0AAD9PZI0_ACRCE|nr:hypothetical protein P5673_027516 [Acropora cervicornis]